MLKKLNLRLNLIASPRLTKEEIRSKIFVELKKQREDERNRKSRLIYKRLFRTKAFREAKNVMFYIAFGGEVNTEEMIKEARRLGKIVTVPVCRENRVTMMPCILDEHATLKKGPYGVREPALKKHTSLRDLDLVIVPGLAFDKKGNRLGRGKGCYDRFLSKLSEHTHSIGLAFGFQILPSVPTTEHDVTVKRVIFA
ncbi:MAG: 5-formyltetrahydrofolate cyclo-ligase [Candidatus Omnitrophica bacterium]|nr:5-formyltetrahydrofolate cyclo-ligase [Candidatus Omnitrophota bacterium]